MRLRTVVSRKRSILVGPRSLVPAEHVSILTTVAIPDDLPGFVLWRTFQLWQRQRRELTRDLGLGNMEVSVMVNMLWLTRTQQPATQAVIARRSGADKMTTSQSVRSLIAKGYLLGEPDPADGRTRLLAITPAGLPLAEQAVRILDDLNTGFFAVLGADQATFVALHQRLITTHQEESAL